MLNGMSVNPAVQNLINQRKYKAWIEANLEVR